MKKDQLKLPLDIPELPLRPKKPARRDLLAELAQRVIQLEAEMALVTAHLQSGG